MTVKVRIDEIKEKGLVLDAEEAIAAFDPLVQIQDEGECQFLAPLTIHLDIKKEYNHVRVSGELATILRMVCSCCLAEFDFPLESRFTVFYIREGAIPQDEEVELSGEDLISATYSGDEIDLTPEIVEQVLLDIPLKPLCKEDCRGLCPTCGFDLNVAECGCDREKYNLKFNVLKNFKVDR